jgi:ATP-dependent DNA helicase RecG
LILKGDASAHDLETETLEFKEQGRSEEDAIRDAVDAALCFANALGGTVVIGVSNKLAGRAAFTGSTFEPALIRRRVYELTEPPLLVDSAELMWGETRLVVIRVPQSPEIHADKKGRAPRRMGTDCLPMSPAEMSRLREDRHGVDWSAGPSGRTPDAIVPAALVAARERLAAFTDSRRELASLSDRGLLAELNLLAADGSLTRAGEILFCRTPRSDSPRIVYQYRGTPGGEPNAIERLAGPLVLEFERVLEFIRVRRHLTPLTLPDGQQIHIEDFPDLAVREAVANAVVHRDYHLSQSVAIDHSPEILAAASPGPLVSGVTPQNILTHPSKPRNHALARAARLLGFAEEIGRGVDRMYREMIRSGRDVPKIESSPDYVRVTLVGGAPNTHIARFVAQLPQQERDDTDTMLILFRLTTERHVTAPGLAPVLQRTPEETEAVLRRLAGESAGVLEPTRQSARRTNPTYRLRGEALQLLGSAVTYQRRTTDEIDRKVLEHVQEYGKVTNRTVRNLLDVTTQRGAAILKDLVSRELLVKTSEAQRGPSVEYGPGKRFPVPRRRRLAADDGQLTIDQD